MTERATQMCSNAHAQSILKTPHAVILGDMCRLRTECRNDTGKEKYWESKNAESVTTGFRNSDNFTLVERGILGFGTNIIFFSVRERAEFNKSCNLIGSGSGRNFPIRPALGGRNHKKCSKFLWKPFQ